MDSSPQNIVAAVNEVSAPAKNGEPDLTMAERQTADPELQTLSVYLENLNLPQDEAQARRVLLRHGQYALVDDILYHLELDKSLCAIPPAIDVRSCFLKHTVAHLEDT